MLPSSTKGTWRYSSFSAVIVLVISGCGSTVQWSDTIVRGGQDTGAQDGRLSIAAPTTGAGDEAQTASGASRNEDKSDRATTFGSRAAGTSVSTELNARGLSGDAVRIGYSTLQGTSEFAKQIGASIDFGNQRAQAEAIVRDINRRGGIAGRKVEIVFHDYTVAQASQNPDGSAQAACSTYTEDRPVFAVINVVVAGESTLNSCLGRRRTPIVQTSLVVRPESAFSDLIPYLYAPSQPTIERLVPAWIRRLGVNNYFTSWDASQGRSGAGPVKIGIVATEPFYGSEDRKSVV